MPLDQRDAGAQPGRARGGDQPRGAGADDHQVIARRGLGVLPVVGAHRGQQVAVVRRAGPEAAAHVSVSRAADSASRRARARRARATTIASSATTAATTATSVQGTRPSARPRVTASAPTT